MMTAKKGLMVERRSLLQAALGVLAAAGAAGALRGGRTAEAGRQTVFLDEANVGAGTTAIRSDVAQETLLVENRAPAGAHRVGVYGYLGTPSENRPLLGTNAGVAGVSTDGGAAIYGVTHVQSGVGVKAESAHALGTALEVQGPSAFSGDAAFAAALSAKTISCQDGTGIQKILASNVAGGTLNDFRLSNNIPRKNAKENKFSGILQAKTLKAFIVNTIGVKVKSLNAGVIRGEDPSTAPVWLASGKAVVAKGSNRVEIDDPHYTPEAKVLATLHRQNWKSQERDITIAFVAGAGPGHFGVHLNDEAPRTVTVDYFICR